MSDSRRFALSPVRAFPRQLAEAAVEEARIIAHVFLMVLIAGTLWRLVSYHLIASPQPHLNHLGLAMAQQY